MSDNARIDRVLSNIPADARKAVVMMRDAITHIDRTTPKRRIVRSRVYEFADDALGQLANLCECIEFQCLCKEIRAAEEREDDV